jgi:mono/diheme cytochrome c family protein
VASLPAVPQRPGVLPLLFICVCVLVAACGREDRKPVVAARQPRVSPRSVRITMDALHQLGGVPAGWQLTPLPGDAEAGRTTFQDLGCPYCHKIAGEPFAGQANGGPGPELTGMGAHHPPAYFLESILNPDAVLVDGPGYVGPGGHSVMPAYPDLTVTQLEDLVAYLSSLTSGDPHAGHTMPMVGVPSAADRPTPPATQAKTFFVQSYDVQPGKVKDFESWFTREGAKKFLAVDGLVGIDTFVDGTRPTQAVTTVFSFRDDAALNAFMTAHDPGSVAVGSEFDAFVGPHDHKIFRIPPVYRVPSLSTP